MLMNVIGETYRVTGAPALLIILAIVGFFVAIGVLIGRGIRRG